METTIEVVEFGSHSHVPPCTTGPNSPCRYAAIPTGPGGEAVTDTFYFVHRPLTADGSITVEVTSLTEVTESGLTSQGRPVRTEPAVVPWSKAGLIITAGAAQGSAYAAVMVTGSHGARMQWNYTGDTPGPAGRVSAASLEQIGPMTAGLAIQATTSLNTLPISPWAGLGVLAAWAAGALLLRMRDA